MPVSTDPSKWKPRRTLGTPSYRYRNYFAAGVLGLGVISAILFE